LHDAIVQLAPLQPAVALGRLHTYPHEPQSLGSVCVSISHPFEATWSQSTYPALHTNPQVPPPHATEAFGSAGHGFEQLPQFCVSVFVLVHVPGAIPHAVSPLGQEHVPLHEPPTGHTVPTLPPLVPQPAVAPQCTSLVFGSTHEPPQLISLPGHATAQALELHTSPSARQLLPALPLPPMPQPVVAPQYWLLLVGSTQVPLQLISLPGQVTAQPLGVQTSPLVVQFWPGLPIPPVPQPAVAPQYWLLEVGSMQVPPQSISLPGHETEHCPLPHTCPEGHATPALPEPLPHPSAAPQCWLLVDGSMQPPLQLISVPGQDTEQVPPEQTWPLGHDVPPAQPAPTPQC
jgi:hypothetical protein